MSMIRLQRVAPSLLSTIGGSLPRRCALQELQSGGCCGRLNNLPRNGSGWISELGLASSGRLFMSGAGSTCIGKLVGGPTSVRAALEIPSSFQRILREGHWRRYATRFPRQGGRIDIGARARQNQARRLWSIVISGSFVAGFIIIVLNTFQENMMFYITPSQALEKYYVDPSKNKFRLGGLVLEGSVYNAKSAADMEFVVTDLANEILVRYRGALPDLFREGHSVVAEGFLRPIDSYPSRPEAANDRTTELAEKAKQAGCYFTAVEVLAKHDEKYMPKEVAAAIEKNKAAQEAQLLTQEGPVAAIPVSLDSPPAPSSDGKRKGISQTPATAQAYEIR